MGGNAGRPPQLDYVDLGYLSLEGHSRQAFLANSKQESIQAFLERFKAANAEYQAIVVIWDNYTSYKSANVKAAAARLGVYLVYLSCLTMSCFLINILKKSCNKEVLK